MGGVLVLTLAVLLVLATRRPDQLQVRRSIDIAAPAARVFALIDDFHNWSRWAPQDLEDRSMQRTFSGAGGGNGAVSQWHSRGSAGAGRMQISASQPTRRVEVTVDFLRPFVARNINEFRLEAHAGTTQVTWSLRTQNLYVMKIMGMFLDMDQKIGTHLGKGLAALKAAAEQ